MVRFTGAIPVGQERTFGCQQKPRRSGVCHSTSSQAQLLIVHETEIRANSFVL